MIVELFLRVGTVEAVEFDVVFLASAAEIKVTCRVIGGFSVDEDVASDSANVDFVMDFDFAGIWLNDLANLESASVDAECCFTVAA